MQLLARMIEIILIMASLWVVINVIHALVTSNNKVVEKGFFLLSSKIKQDLGEISDEEKNKKGE